MTDPNQCDTMDTSAKTDCGAQCDFDLSDDSTDNLIVVLTGNSAAIEFGPENILLGEKQPNIENEDICRIDPVQIKLSERHVSVINMIDLLETEHVDHFIGQLVNENEIHSFIFVVQLGQLTDADKMGLEWLQKVFSDKVLQFVMILFTYEREEERDTLIDDLKKNPVLEQLLEKSGERYQTCNKMMNNQSEMSEMMKKIDYLINENQQQCYTGEMYNTALRETEDLKKGKCDSASEGGRLYRRIVLLGKTGVGKSAAGNTILGHKVFRSERSSNTVTRKSTVKHTTVPGKKMSIVDTPGFFDTEMKHEELAKEIGRSVYLSSPGPHAFLIVFRVDERFTEHEEQIPQKIEMMFGEGVLKYSIILFTRGDQLEEKPIEDDIKQNSKLRNLVGQCGGRYQVFNNKDKNNREQVNDLLQKIDTMIEQNKQGHYSNQMFEDAIKFRQEEETKQEEKHRQGGTPRAENEMKSGFEAFYSKNAHLFAAAAAAAGITSGSLAATTGAGLVGAVAVGVSAAGAVFATPVVVAAIAAGVATVATSSQKKEQEKKQQ